MKCVFHSAKLPVLEGLCSAPVLLERGSRDCQLWDLGQVFILLIFSISSAVKWEFEFGYSLLPRDKDPIQEENAWESTFFASSNTPCKQGVSLYLCGDMRIHVADALTRDGGNLARSGTI